MNCKNCGAPLNETSAFCSECGAKVIKVDVTKKFCTECGAQMKTESRYCPNCGFDTSYTKFTWNTAAAPEEPKTEEVPQDIRPDSVDVPEPAEEIPEAQPMQPVAWENIPENNLTEQTPAEEITEEQTQEPVQEEIPGPIYITPPVTEQTSAEEPAHVEDSPEAQAFCIKCGTPLNGMRFCINCGTDSLAVPSAETAEETAAEEPVSISEPVAEPEPVKDETVPNPDIGFAFCLKCGAPLTPGCRFCIKCGFDTSTVKIDVTESPAPAAEEIPVVEAEEIKEEEIPVQESQPEVIPAETVPPVRPAFCINCGTPIKPDDMFCSGCGKKVG